MAGDLVLDGTIHCNDDLPLPQISGACDIKISVTGGMVLESGSAILAENRRGAGDGGDISLEVGGDLTLRGPDGSLAGALVSTSRLNGTNSVTGAFTATVGGAVDLQAGSVLHASSKIGRAGDIKITGATVRVAGLVASGPTATVLSTRLSGVALEPGSTSQQGGTIHLKAVGSAEPGLRIESEATVVSQGDSDGGRLVLLEACGIEVRGLVASLSRNMGPSQVVLRSGKGILVDGRDLGNADPSEGRFGRIRADGTEQGALGYLVDLFAQSDLQILGPDPATASGLFAVSSAPGNRPLRFPGGTITAISLAGALSATGNAFETGRNTPGNQGGAVDLQARGDVTLDDAVVLALGGIDPATYTNTRKGGQIDVRSFQGAVSWTFGVGDVRPTGSTVAAPRRGTIEITACSTIDITGSQFPVNGSPVAPFPVETEGVCSPTAPSLPAGEPPLPDCEVEEVNEAPTDLALDSSTVNENAAPGTPVGNLSTVDPDAGDSHTYSLVPGDGSTHNGLFQIVGNQLQVAGPLDFEAGQALSVRIRTTDSGGLFYEEAFTITVIDVNEPPTPVTDTYTAFGNTQLAAGGAGGTHRAFSTDPDQVDANDTDPDTKPEFRNLAVVAASGTTSQGGSYSINADGSFLYQPPVGYTGPDSFSYSLSDGTNTVPGGVVQITVEHRIWYVHNEPGTAGNAGDSGDPVDTLAEAESKSGPGDHIYVFEGDGTNAGMDAGITLKDGQKLIGEALDLVVAGTKLVDVAEGVRRPEISDINDTVSVLANTANGNRTGIEIRGLQLSSTGGSAIDLTSANAASLDAVIHDVVITETGAAEEGIDVNAGSTGTTGVSVSNVRLTTEGNAFDARTSAAGNLRIDFSNNSNILSNASGVVIDGSGGGVTTITGFANNSVHPNTAGTGVSVANATFDGVPGGALDPIAFGNLVIGASVGGVGGAGLVLTNVHGDLSFSNLNIFADGGAGLRASSPTVFTGGAGLRMTAGTGIVQASGGPAVDITQAAINLPLSTIKSTNSPTTGLALNSVTGAFSAESGSSISNIASAAGTAFQVGSSNATINYKGSISTTQGRGVHLTSNGGSTIHLAGTLTLSTGIQPAFNATGGGTVTADNTSNTLTTTTATALNVVSTTIGAGGVKFRSISAGTAASGPTHGIVLNNTGSSGGLTVLGAGSAGSGGTIQRAATGISLTGTRDVSLAYMQLNDHTDFGVRGASVVNFSMANTVITGTNGNDAGADEGSVRFTELTGSATISSSNISGAAEDNVAVVNTTGTLNRLTISNTTIGANSTTTGGDGLFVEAQGSAVINATVQNSFFTSSRGDLAQFTQGSTGSMDVVIQGTAFSDNHPAIVSGGGGVIVGGTNGSMTFNVNNNTFRDATGTALAISCGNAGQNCAGRIENNQVGLAGAPNSGSTGGSGIAVVSSGGGTLTALVNNNQVRQYNNHGILLQAGQTLGNLTTFNVTVTNNTISNPGVLNTNFNGIHLNNGTVPGESFTSCVDIRSNSIAGAGAGAVAPNNADFRLRQRQSTTVRLPGYGGANNDDAAVVSFVSGNQTSVTSGAASNTVGSGGGGFVGGAACVLPL